MTEAEVVEFLVRYLMEFGAEETTFNIRMSNEWYGGIVAAVQDYELAPYFDLRGSTAMINQAGLDLIRRYHDRS